MPMQLGRPWGGGISSWRLSAFPCILPATPHPVPAPDTTSATPAAPSTTDRSLVFEARGLRKVYQTGEVDVVALHGVNLDFYTGELVVLLGASGSGKSTLLNILGGLDVPTSGQLHYKGWELTDADEKVL